MLFAFIAVPVLIAALVVGVVQYGQNGRNYGEEQERLMGKLASGLDAGWDSIKSVGQNQSFGNAMRRLMGMDRSVLTQDMLAQLRLVQMYFSATYAGNSAVSRIYAYIDDGYYISNSSAWRGQPDMLFALPNLSVYTAVREIVNQSADSEWHLIDSVPYYGKRLSFPSAKNRAYVVICVSRVFLNSLINGALSENRYARGFMIVNAAGELVLDTFGGRQAESLSEAYPELSDGTSRFALEGARYDAMRSDANIPGWQYILVRDLDMLERETVGRLVVIALCMAVVLGLCLLVTWRMAAVLCRPYQIILDLLRSPVQDAALEYDAKYASYDELGMIYTLIHETKYINFTMQNELTEQQKALRSAQNVALQAQISPHFLFNTLEAINWRVFEKLPDDREITRMIQKLSLLLRISIEKESLHALEKELKHAQTYLDILRERFQDDDEYRIEWSIAPDTLNCRVVSLSIQPLLENAISHGVKQIDHGVIKIASFRDGDRLVISITDNGPGIDPANLERMRRRLADSRFLEYDHIGIINVNARIQLIFGLEYGITVSSAPYEATEVRMTLPYATGTEESDV